jgi:predicted metal-dependent HD superfamily phosphohydrolase
MPEAELVVAWQRSVDRDTHLLDGLLARHREPHRRYHTATHVRWVVRHVDELAAVVAPQHADEVIAAAFYHDAVYDPRRADNEHVSAELARRDLTSLGWDDDRVRRVAQMIEATAHLDPDAATVDSGDTALLLDADLAILGAEPAAYSAYVSGVRQEYAHVADAEWRTGRGRVLSEFLDGDTIFLTPAARDRWEAQARANLAAELASLR